MAAKPPPEPPVTPAAEPPVEDMPLGNEETPLPGSPEPVEPDAPETVAETAGVPTLSAKEIEELRYRARKDAEREFKTKLKDKVLAEEKKKAREQLSMADNEHLNGVLSDMVRITIDIPEFSNVPWIQFNQPNGQCYIHGQTYPVKRHVGNQLRESMQWMRRHQNEIDGKKRNRQLPDGRFVDVVTGRVSDGRTVSAAGEA
jgi:hypothetical protein